MARRSRPSITLSAMKPTELMIGDWVMFTDPADESKYPVRIKSINTNSCVGIEGKSLLCLSCDFEPIPITHEILEKNGFEKLMDTSEETAKRLGRKPQFTGFWMLEIGDFDSVTYDPEKHLLRIKLMMGYTSDFDNIVYIHQLQHAIHLCNIEKDIEL